MTTPRDEMIELRDLRFRFRDWAPRAPGAPALVLLHGYTGHARSWDAFARAMTDRYRVLALDQRGHGETQWAPPDAYGTLEMVADLAAFVRALGLRDLALLGLSMGGIVSFAYAGERPAELGRLVIVDIAPEIAPRGLARIMASVHRRDVFASPAEAFALARADNPVPPPDHQRERVENNLMRTEDGAWTYRYDRALRDPAVPRERLPPAQGWRRARRIAVPTLLIRGELSDILARPVAERLAREIPDCRLEEVPGAGHPVPLDQPDAFLAVARTFL